MTPKEKSTPIDAAAKLRQARMSLNLHKKNRHRDKPIMDDDFRNALEKIGSAIIILETGASSTHSTKADVEAKIRIKELEDLKVMFTIEFQQMRAFDDSMEEDDVHHIIDSRIASLKPINSKESREGWSHEYDGKTCEHGIP